MCVIVKEITPVFVWCACDCVCVCKEWVGVGTDEIEGKWDGVLVHCKLMALDELNHIPKECREYTP